MSESNNVSISEGLTTERVFGESSWEKWAIQKTITIISRAGWFLEYVLSRFWDIYDKHYVYIAYALEYDRNCWQILII